MERVLGEGKRIRVFDEYLNHEEECTILGVHGNSLSTDSPYMPVVNLEYYEVVPID